MGWDPEAPGVTYVRVAGMHWTDHPRNIWNEAHMELEVTQATPAHIVVLCEVYWKEQAENLPVNGTQHPGAHFHIRPEKIFFKKRVLNTQKLNQICLPSPAVSHVRCSGHSAGTSLPATACWLEPPACHELNYTVVKHFAHADKNGYRCTVKQVQMEKNSK